MAAVQVRTAVPSANRYLIRIDVIDLTSHTVKTIDAGGDFMHQSVSGIGDAVVSTGYAAATPLIWSPDGNSLYFLKRSAGTTQIWRAEANGSGSKSVSDEAQGVDDFALPDDRHLVYWSRQPDPAAEEALKAEALRGFRYDARFIPLFANGPQVSGTRRVAKTIELSSGRTREAIANEAAAAERFLQTVKGGASAISNEGRRAYLQVSEGEHGSGVGTIAIESESGGPEVCTSPNCAGAMALWWTKDGKDVRFIRRDGWGKSETAIYEWKPGTSRPKRLYVTSDLLLDCQPRDLDLVCARERSADPRHIVLLNPDTGRVTLAYDANRDFHRFSLGAIKRLYWRNEFGIEVFGDLVYPVGYTRGRTYPLIVVQYISRGFLRGGVGDEFPIQLFANHGYAVLSVQRPDSSLLPMRSDQNSSRRESLLTDFKDRRSVLSAIEIGVQILIERGIVNPREVGITGLSDGSSTVQFALVNSTMFSAASASGCCWEPYQDAIVGPGAARAYHKSGWPMLVNYNSDFWSRMSLVVNAGKILAPLLIQQSDDEFRGALSSYAALKQANRPISLYVFPGEHHVKWQPTHRLAAYERNLRWFDFWLRGIGDGREWQSDD
jgi:dipeptidyl aminopeptidase/acylaminoacyl peptidase